MKKWHRWLLTASIICCLGITGCQAEDTNSDETTALAETVAESETIAETAAESESAGETETESESIAETAAQTETESSAQAIDAGDYLEGFSQLVQLLNMEPTESWQFSGENSYVKDRFYLEWDGDAFSMRNDGTDNVLLYGTCPGDDMSKVDEALQAAGWTVWTGDDSGTTYIAIFNQRKFMLSAISEAGKITSWYLNNWPQGEWVSEAYSQLEAAD